MKAAVMTSFKKPLEIQDLPDPSPGPADAIVQVEACGICRSDWHLWQQHWTWLGIELELPRVLGHELSGEIVEVGENPQGRKVGDEVVLVPYMQCGKCHACLRGKTNCCVSLELIGVHRDGGMCEFISMPTSHLLRAMVDVASVESSST